MKFIPIILACLMAFIDVFSLGILKEISIGKANWKLFLPASVFIYSLQPIIFLQSLQYETMTVMNLMWDITSDILVTCIGLFYFKETISSIKKLGLMFAFISIFLLSYEDL